MTTLPDDLDALEATLLHRTAALAPATAPRGAADGSPGAPDGAAPTGDAGMGADVAATLFTAQATSRALDHAARWLRQQGHGHYTIGSAGHESDAAVALALRPDDPALLHYRSGGFWCARAAQVPGHDAVGDVLRGMLARSTEPIAGGRHKVFGSVPLGVVPMTSTIGSHLPRAVGLATALGQRRRGEEGRWPADAVVVASLGDASLNHSTVQGALNWAGNQVHRGLRLPLLVVVEDNGLGISVPTPAGWVAASLARLVGFEVATADGDDPAAVHAASVRLADRARRTGRPGVLHLRTVRFLGHAGSDVEAAYRTPDELRADLDRDPLLATAELLVSRHGADPDALVAEHLALREEVRERALSLLGEPVLRSADEVAAPLAPHDPAAVAARAAALADAPAGVDADEPLTLAGTLTATLRQVLHAVPRARVFGEDVGRKGGVYGVTRGLQDGFGPGRVFDTVLDEQSVLGLALGAALDGNVPLPEVQYLAYLHNAEDQLRGEAATLRFFSRDQFRNGMVVRVAGLAYQKGFGGHFHNDNGVAVLRDVPGLVVACPAHPADAAPLLRTLVAGAEVEGMVSVLLEPIARYHTRDLHEGDGAWLAPLSHEPAPLGRAAVHGDGTDLAIVTFGNGTWMARRAAARLAEQDGVRARVVDLRWLAPLPVDDVVAAATACGRVLVADETRRAGGVGEGVVAELVDAGFTGPVRRVASRDSLVPLGAAADLVLLQEDDVVSAARAMTIGA